MRQHGGNWNDGYVTTGFFIQYLTTKNPDFARKVNSSARDYGTWSWDLLCKDVFGKGVQPLWTEYQQSF